jgi:hypothetical protein
MTLSRIARRFGMFFLFFSLPLQAQLRHHALTPLGEVTICGVVREASTGAPVAGAVVHSGTSFCMQGGTKADGKYTLTLPGGRTSLISAEHFAYDTQTVGFLPTNGGVLDFSLNPRPAVTVKLVSGQTKVLDLGTSKFGYLFPFAGYASADNANLCKPDGSPFAPLKTEIAKIIGPAVPVSFSPCCTIGAVSTVNVEMKSGEKTAAYFNDSCYGYEVDFFGRERSTGTFLYDHFKDITEIDFP